MEILPASSPGQIEAIRCLLQEYATWIGIDLSYQGFARELAALPGVYAPPQGRLLLATDADRPVGCVALRPAGGNSCEMKRLFVRPAWQGHGLGRSLALRVISEARNIGYSNMKLDTLSTMQPAIQLYESLGFVRVPAYYDSPLLGTMFMELQL